jgi:hypothetical protein
MSRHSVCIISPALRCPRGIEHGASLAPLLHPYIPGARQPCWQLPLRLGLFYDCAQEVVCQHGEGGLFAQAHVQAHGECHVVVWFAYAAAVASDAAG